jgi:hypothetical protein
MDRVTDEYYDLQQQAAARRSYHLLAEFAIKQMANTRPRGA